MRASGFGHRQTRARTGVRGAGVKAVSPAERGRSGATRLDGGEHTRTLLSLTMTYESSILPTDSAEDPSAASPGGATVTGEDGKFWVVSLVPDTPIRLQATRGGRESNVVTVNVGPGALWTDVKLRLP